MPATPTIIGALLGLGTQMYSNALRKLPYMRHPWEHVVGMGLGAVFVNQLVKWDEKLKEDLDKMLERAKQANERRYFDSNGGMEELEPPPGQAEIPGFIDNQQIVSISADSYNSWMMMMISYFHIGLSATRLFFFSLYGLYTWFGPSICSRRINTRLAISTAVL
ncbi:hypothetical protein DAI22_07g151000 [Oryza sativa Japonica Group]|nr:hypothetical protein DAI22_07g151000 [Oryza sativa Japonica Group]